MSDLTLDVDQAGELKAAFRRGNWTNSEIKTLSEGDRLAKVRLFVRGDAVITMRATSNSKLEPVLPGGSGIKLPGTLARNGKAFPKSKIVGYPDSSLSLLPETQPEGVAKMIVPYRLRANMSFAQMVGDRFGMVGRSLVELEEAIIAQGMQVAPDQIAFVLRMTAEHPKWSPFGLALNGNANFWLVKVSDQPGERLAVVHARWYEDGRRWHVYAYRFDYALVWLAGYGLSLGSSL